MVVILQHNFQISRENVEALVALKSNNNFIPVIMEMCEMLNNYDSKRKILSRNINNINSFYTGSAVSRQGTIVNSIREMKQDIFILSSILTDNQNELIKFHVHIS